MNLRIDLILNVKEYLLRVMSETKRNNRSDSHDCELFVLFSFAQFDFFKLFRLNDFVVLSRSTTVLPIVQKATSLVDRQNKKTRKHEDKV